MTDSPCPHEYVEVEDWEGDFSAGPSYVNVIKFWRCIHCDEERSDRPPEDQIYEPDYEALSWN